MLTSVLLPDSDRLKLDGFLVEDNTIIFILTAVQPDGQCPNCNHLSNSVHSHYRRAVTDLPWAGVPVRLRLHVRKFFCHNAQGARTIFTERLPTVVAPWARRSVRLTAQQRQLRLDCGGETGARISQRMGLPASADTILRSVRGGGMLAHPTPRVLGVDDWARRKGQTYGTLLVDLESHEPVDLLSGRTADVLAKWLREHPGVEIITRDRSREAVQVADRFHLLSNLREALEAVLVRQGVTLSASPFSTAPVERVSRDHLRHWAAHRPISGDRGGETQPNEVLTASTASSPAAQRYAPERAANRTRRKARYDEVIALHQQGLSQKAMAVRTGLSRKTIGSWLRSGMFPERAPTRKRNTLLARFEPYLRARWSDGCHNGTQLWRELCQQGYTGSRTPVAQWVARHRHSSDPPPLTDPPDDSPPLAPQPSTARRSRSPRQISWLLIRHPANLNSEERAFIERLVKVNPAVAAAYRFTQDFRQMLKERAAEAFDPWLSAVEARDLPDLQRFAAGPKRDYPAVFAALSLPWSYGPVEGHVNRLKLIKRTMYGPASFDLLRQRVLAA